MNTPTTEEDIKAAQEKDKQIHITNLQEHLRTIQAEMEKTNIKMLVSPTLKANTLIHDSKRYMELQIAAGYINQVGNWAYPAEKVEARTDKGQDLTIPIPENAEIENTAKIISL